MTLNQVNYSQSSRRGLAQPESAEEKRRRLHREAASDVKAYSAALKEAKKRYQDYDVTMVPIATEKVE